ncbi:hypothetical protein Btru_033553 [Bulinus truncatus]|nr:hypothetical protein Btru_033553 [Bulinus truncatus]
MWIYFVLNLLFITVASQAPCTNCFYSSGRKFQCHCADKCDSEGKCIGASTDCSSGWFGLRCQYQNLAYYYIKNIEPSRAGGLLSGSTNSQCSNDSSLQSVSVTWNMSLPFTWLRLKLADNGSLDNFTLSFVLTKTNVSVSCVNQTMYQVDETTFDIHCVISEATSQFKLEGKIVRSICSLKVNGVDVVPVRLKHFKLEALDNKNVTIFYYKDQQDTYQLVYTVLYLEKGLVNGIRFNQTNIYYPTDKNPYVSINEFQAFGECRSGYWDLNCSRQCQSPCTDYCSMEDGSCNSICIGYNDPPKCSKECTVNKWGINCKKDCSSSCYNSSCDKQTGQCLYGCNGFSYPPSCTQACQNNSWGNNCISPCSLHCLRGICNAQSGTCNFGCDVGYQLPDCTQTCEDDHFGLNCSQLCSKQCLAGTCRSDSGKCHSCIEGYHGDHCDTFDNSWQKYFGIGFGAGVGSLLIVQAVVFVIVYLRGRRSKGDNVHNSPIQVYNLPDVSNKDKHEYETVKKSSRKDDSHYEDIGNTVDIG